MDWYRPISMVVPKISRQWAEVGKNVSGTKFVLEKLDGMQFAIIEAVNELMAEGVQMFEDEIKKNISLTDHSLAELRALDHPYARRHGERGQPIHEPYWLVHTRGAGLIRAMYSGVISENGRTVDGYVGFDIAAAPHATYVIFGTIKMIARDFMTPSLNVVIPKLRGKIIRRLGKEMRSQTIFSMKNNYPSTPLTG